MAMAHVTTCAPDCSGHRSNRWRAAASLLLVGGFAVVLSGQQPPPTRIIEAESFVVKDGDGRRRAEFGCSGDVTFLRLLDPMAGQPLVVISVEQDAECPPGRPKSAVSIADSRSDGRILIGNFPVDPKTVVVQDRVTENHDLDDQMEVRILLFANRVAPAVDLGVRSMSGAPMLHLNSPRSPSSTAVMDSSGRVVFSAP